MARIEMVMPKMGESVMEATVLAWLKNVGDTIEQDESVLEVATDKVDTDVPAVEGGTLVEILAQEGDVIQVGKTIAVIETNDNKEETPKKENTEEQEQMEVNEMQSQVLPREISNENQPKRVGKDGRFYSPLVLNIAKKENIDADTLENIVGTGKNGRLTKKDLLQFLQSPNTSPQKSAPISGTTIKTVTKDHNLGKIEPMPERKNTLPSIPAYKEGENVEVIQMSRMRKMIAERMLESKRISPHVTSFVEADVTTIVRWRAQNKHYFKEKEGVSLTYTPIFIEAVVKAIKDYPMINCSVDGDNIILKKDINIGVAVALPDGNLIVPVIKNADRLNISGLTKAINDLAKRARNNKLKPDELSGGTYTISNMGSFGNVMGTPIIMQPQVGILALGAVEKKPAVVDTPDGDVIGIRYKMFLSHSYDHRVIDGSLGGMFVRRVADYLEKFDRTRKG